MKRFNWGLIGAIVLCLAVVVLLAGCGVSKAEYEALLADKAVLTSDLADLQADYDTLNASYSALQANYSAAQNDLAALEAVYPPREFASRSALEDWLDDNDVSEEPITMYAEDWYGKALKLQADALADGYIVSVDYDYSGGIYYIYCTTVIDGDIYYWDPETDDVYRENDLTNVE